MSGPSAEKEFQDIMAELASMMGSFAAVILQMAHPQVANVVADSYFTEDPVARGRRSLIYIYCMAFGSSDECNHVRDKVQCAHNDVPGSDAAVDDPEMHLFVAATIYRFMVLSYENVYGELD
ncbi:hypothetical protein F5884DRAFT_838944 [Xylogone sp. PMI_703]|nr:hypothetical protein F5884DRAFT_838944 [Xylogone sp. PMI_703]